MTLFFLILGIAIVGYFAISIYRHDNTSFYKLTGYSYFDLWTDKKVREKHHLVKALDTVKGPHKILVNLEVPSNETLLPIDAVLLHESGIYVIKVKAMTGWVNGRERDIQWTQLLHKDKSRLFDNPVHETKKQNYALQDQLPEMTAELFETIVIFTNDCSFQQVEIQSEDVDVIKASELKNWVGSLSGQRLTETEIQSIYAALEGMMNVKNTTVTLKNTISSTN